MRNSYIRTLVEKENSVTLVAYCCLVVSFVCGGKCSEVSEPAAKDRGSSFTWDVRLSLGQKVAHRRQYNPRTTPLFLCLPH